ncbi:MAG TPA: (Fe-S)-binding protein [Vicinamibacterales bacterium]|nr:(Fe-S)-binding protein [Vicinamibacterales bacterium]
MRVSLFITCLVDQFHPEVGLGMVRVLDRLGVECDVPLEQTCCGQPAFNSGCTAEARAVGRRFLKAFRDSNTIVAPSGSCTAMAKVHLSSLFAPGTPEHTEARSIAARVHEFSEFIVKRLRVTDVGAVFPHRVTYHDSCHLLRELGIRDEPRQLLGGVRDLELVEMATADTCCGFGGTFAVKYPEISAAMGGDKLAAVDGTGAEFLVANDTGCLMHLRGLLARRNSPVRAVHLAQILAGEVTGG